jgi:hypothetical protein
MNSHRPMSVAICPAGNRTMPATMQLILRRVLKVCDLLHGSPTAMELAAFRRANVRHRPKASTSAMQLIGRSWGNSGHRAYKANRSLLTHSVISRPSITALRKIHQITVSSRGERGRRAAGPTPLINQAVSSFRLRAASEATARHFSPVDSTTIRRNRQPLLLQVPAAWSGCQ